MNRAENKKKKADTHLPFMVEDEEKKNTRLKHNIQNIVMEVKDEKLGDDATETQMNRNKISASRELAAETEEEGEEPEDKEKTGIEIMAEGILAAMKRGCTKEELCLELGLTPSRLTKLEREQDIIREALEDGEIYSKAWWLKTGRLALNQNGFNVGLWKTMMANRFGFSGETGDGGRPVNNFYSQINIASLSSGTVKEISDSLLDKPLLPDWGDWKKNG